MPEPVCGCQPILCAPLIRRVDAALLELLSELKPDDWQRPTLAPGWTVGDVTAHLLDGALRKLSFCRDGWRPRRPGGPAAEDVVALVNRLNREGVLVYGRLSPRLLVDLLGVACGQFADFHESLDPFAQAVFGVSWAGEERSLNWFDCARELTERWHHQQQIRRATGRPVLMAREYYHPVLDCFLRGLPHLYRGVDATPGAVVCVEIEGDCGGVWQLERAAGGWHFRQTAAEAPLARVVIPQELAWQLFTKALDPASAEAAIAIYGDRTLGARVLELTAIVG